MPIAGFSEYSAAHWLEVRDILERAIRIADFEPRPVWERSETDIIQGRIIRNLYEYEVTICDISGLNPNVMFELGLRLAFKKPVVIIVDDETKIPFDTSVIEHKIYNRKLNFSRTEKFIEEISAKLVSLHNSYNNKDYVAYIDSFGAFSTFEPNSQKVEVDQFILDRLDQISANVSRLRHEQEELRWISRKSQVNALRDFDKIVDSKKKTIAMPTEADEVMRSLWEDGAKIDEIAGALGMSRVSVLNRAQRLGLVTREENGA